MNDTRLSEPPNEREHVLARKALARRYVWEVEAITQDIINKMEMEVLNVDSIASYLANLLQSHPRTQVEDRAAETIMVSQSRYAMKRALTVTKVLEPPSNEEWLPLEAYYAMGQDVLTALETQQIHVKPQEE